MEGIYKFDADFGRSGELTGIFVSTEQEITDIIGKEVYFGEALGKHSEVSMTVEEDNFTLVTTDANFIKLFLQYDLSNGHNPFDYIDEDYIDEDYDDEED